MATEGDVPVDGFFWRDGQRYKRIGLSSIVAVDDVGESSRQAVECHPFDAVDEIEAPSNNQIQRAP